MPFWSCADSPGSEIDDRWLDLPTMARREVLQLEQRIRVVLAGEGGDRLWMPDIGGARCPVHRGAVSLEELKLGQLPNEVELSLTCQRRYLLDPIAPALLAMTAGAALGVENLPVLRIRRRRHGSANQLMDRRRRSGSDSNKS
jgi:hypothetical protein